MIAFIPARGGSKELKNKNIKIFAGKPLIAHTITEALNSKLISKVLVLTDSQKIAEISKKYGATVPFLRPKYLAKDNSNVVDTYLYFLKKMKLNKNYENFIVLQPTSPIRTRKEIDKAIKFFTKNKATSLVSVCKNKFPLNWAKSIKTVKGLNYIKNLSKNNNLNRQSYKDVYVPNGNIYIININKFLKYKTYYFNNTLAFIMNEKYSIYYNDIDNKFHFYLSEIIFKNKKL